MKAMYVNNRDDWRKWLEQNHDKEKEVWLIYFESHTGKLSIPYEDSVEEALCFGWIDSIIKKMDDEKFARKFTPRTNTTKWSESNKARVRKLIKEGRMTEIGLAKIKESMLNHKEETIKDKLKKKLAIPKYLKEAFMANSKVWENFNKLAPSHQRNYVGWIISAKKQETREKRMKEAIGLLAKNKKLGLK
jgi:uncharacterized protein YdeI (YjbR/CyaY-like superfamily)